jgi:DNA-binding response OmpR family regulator
MKPKIIVVDDDKLICELYAEHLIQNGFMAYTAFSVREALDRIKRHKPDLILTDVILPKETGFDLYEKVKLLSPELPIIFMTGYESDENTYAHLNKIGKKWISKPVVLEELLELIRSELKE